MHLSEEQRMVFNSLLNPIQILSPKLKWKNRLSFYQICIFLWGLSRKTIVQDRWVLRLFMPCINYNILDDPSRRKNFKRPQTWWIFQNSACSYGGIFCKSFHFIYVRFQSIVWNATDEKVGEVVKSIIRRNHSTKT